MKMLTPTIAKAVALLSFSALSTLAIAPAQAVILDFNDFTSSATGIKTYTNQGFTITAQPGSALFPSTDIGILVYNGNIDAITRLTKVDGGAFDLFSIDLTSFAEIDSQSVKVTFTGTRADTSTVAQSFTTDAVLNALETFNFNNFNNLVSVDWAQVAPYHQFDNINVSATTAVPEPFTILGTIFGAGYSVALKRKLAKAQADK
jgi:hypothetical protein